MTTKTQTLIERARLTEEEVFSATGYLPIKGLLDAQLAKAFDEFAKWLDEQTVSFTAQGEDFKMEVKDATTILGTRLRNELVAAGLEST